MPPTSDFHWIKTVGAPRAGDSRDGELHQVPGPGLPTHFDLEPWEDDPHGADARYVLAAGEAVIDAEGREVWTYTYSPPQ
jgi:hypothetical protein